jgi:hypothetical protein
LSGDDDRDCSSREIEFPDDSMADTSKAIQIPIAAAALAAHPWLQFFSP